MPKSVFLLHCELMNTKLRLAPTCPSSSCNFGTVSGDGSKTEQLSSSGMGACPNKALTPSDSSITLSATSNSALVLESSSLSSPPPVHKPKQSAVELLLLQQTQETTQESIAQQTSDTLQFAAAGTDTQESLTKAREVGKQQALTFGAKLSDNKTDVDMCCCANKYCRAKGMNWKLHHACNSCKGMVHLVCNRPDQTGLDMCLECLSKAWWNE